MFLLQNHPHAYTCKLGFGIDNFVKCNRCYFITPIGICVLSTVLPALRKVTNVIQPYAFVVKP